MQSRYAAGSIVEKIEKRELPVNAGIQPDKVITVSAVNRFGFKIFTTHYYSSGAEWLRNHYADRRYQNIT